MKIKTVFQEKIIEDLFQELKVKPVLDEDNITIDNIEEETFLNGIIAYTCSKFYLNFYIHNNPETIYFKVTTWISIDENLQINLDETPEKIKCDFEITGDTNTWDADDSHKIEQIKICFDNYLDKADYFQYLKDIGIMKTLKEYE